MAAACKAALWAAVAISMATSSVSFMTSPTITRSVFAPAAGARVSEAARLSSSVSASLAGARLSTARLSMPLKASKSAISSLSMSGKIKAEYIWIGGRGGVGDDYR